MTASTPATKEIQRTATQILAEMSDYLTGSVPISEAIEKALSGLLAYLGGELSLVVTTLTEDKAFLEVRGQQAHRPAHLIEEINEKRPLSEIPISQQVLKEQRPIILSRQQAGEKFCVQERRFNTSSLYAIYYLPLMVAGDPIGILHISMWQPGRTFSSEEINLCQGVANLLAAAFENRRLLIAERKQLRLAKTLQKVGALLTTQLSLEGLYEKIFSLLAEVIAFDAVSIQLLDDASGRLKLVAAKGFDLDEKENCFPDMVASCGLNKFAPGQNVAVIPDTFAHSLWVRGGLARDIRSWIGALLLVKGEIIGVLNVDSYEVNAFTEAQGQVVGAFANQAAVAIANTRLHHETERRAEELAVLHQLGLDIASVVAMDELFTTVTAAIVQKLYPDDFGFLLLDERQELVLPYHAYHGLPAAVLAQPVPLAESLCGLVIESGQPAWLDDVRQAPRYVMANPLTLSEVAVPIKVAERTIGVINAESPKLGAFTTNDVLFLTTLSSLISASIERADMVLRLQAHSEDLAHEVARQTAALKSERDRTIAVLENAGESILLLDQDGQIVYVNKALEDQSGFSREEVLGYTPAFLVGEEAFKKAYGEFWERLTRGEMWKGQLINQRRDGAYYDVAVTMVPLFDEAGNLEGFVVVQANITQMKALERLKTEFVANVTHELRTPLTNVKTYLTLAERGREEQRERYFRILHHETDRLTQLIQDLLDLSHLETETLPAVVKPVNLKTVIQEYVDVFEAKAEMKEIEIEVQLPAAETAVFLADKHVGQLLTNLLGNAIAYTPVGGKVSISAGEEWANPDHPIWFKITDNGVGIVPDDLPYVFARFYRGALGREQQIPGTGLGLAICAEIVRRYQGDITIESEVGKGTSFTVFLPGTVLEGEGDDLA